MATIDLITLTTFTFVMCVAWLITRAAFRPRETVIPRGSLPRYIEDEPSPLGRAFIESLAGVLPQCVFGRAELEKDLRRAGKYGAIAKLRVFAWRNSLVILSLLTAGIVAVLLGPERQRAVWWTVSIGLLAAIVFYSVSRVNLAIKARRRLGLINAALPDALDTISMCMQGGISLQECLEYVSRELASVHPDLALELMMVGQHTKTNSFEFAFKQFAYRIDSPEVVSLSSLVMQNQQLGTGVVDSIREFADNLRLKRRQMAEAKAGRVELFLLFPVVFCLLPAVVMLLWSPPILSIIKYIQSPITQVRVNQ